MAQREGSLRDVAAKIGIGHATLHRVIQGKPMTLDTAKALLAIMPECPCCGKPVDAEVSPKSRTHIAAIRARGTL